MFTRRRWELADEEVDEIVRLTGVSAGAQVLDLCCGPGRHALAFGAKGFRVTGVDRTECYIAAANEKAAELDFDLTFLVGDARKYRRPDYYDLAVCLYTSFGYFETVEEDNLLLGNMCECLKAGCAFVLDINGKEVAQRVFRENWFEDFEEGFTVSEVRKVGPDWDWIENKWTVNRDGLEKSASFRVRMYSGDDLSESLLSVGFDSVELFGDWSGMPYNDQARRLIAVARK